MKQEHSIWLEWNSLSPKYKIQGVLEFPLISKWHYIYYIPFKTEEISLVHFRHDLYDPYHWEIHCLKGNLFDDIMRFKSKQDAEIVIKQYLEPSYWCKMIKYFKNKTIYEFSR